MKRVLRLAAALAVICVSLNALAQVQSPGSMAASLRGFLQIYPDDEAVKSTVKTIEGAPEVAGNWLDLIVLMCERRQTAEVRKLIEYVEITFSPPEGIREVLELLKQSKCGSDDTLRAQVSAVAVFGYDSNVNQGSSNPLFDFGNGTQLPLAPEFLPIGDRFGLFGAAISWGTPRTFQMGLQVRKREYDRLHRFDTQAVSVLLEKDWLCQGHLCTVSANVGHLDLGGRSYQSAASAQASWSSHSERQGEFLTLAGDVAYQRFVQNANLNAWLGQARATYFMPIAALNGQLQASASAGMDLPLMNRPGGRRHFGAFGVGGSHALSAPLRVDWFLLRQSTRESEPYSPGLIDTTRASVLQQASISLARQVSASQSIRIELRRAANRDAVSLFSYRSTALTIGWQWLGNY